MSLGDTRRPWTSSQWTTYFRANAASLLPIPWDQGVMLSDEEKAAVASSIAEFQIGESSEGRHFLGRSRDYAIASGDEVYAEAARLFIAEEHRHARDLARVLDLAGMARISRSLSDSVFRFLRRILGLEVSISVLITAEILAQVYYEALREATGSAVLRVLCEQILNDEAEHVRFQAERLAILRSGRRPETLVILRLIHRLFFAATCLVVWRGHRRVFRRGGYGFHRFLAESARCLQVALHRMDPAHYASKTPMLAPIPMPLPEEAFP
ncbi:MAG: hypothetical protein JWN86_629 [Planctomycetota bacterium]|nr:hypothetical protein [Planctomycetota bacterium]